MSKGVEALRMVARTVRLMREQHQARRRAMALERREEALRLQRVCTGVVVVLRRGARRVYHTCGRIALLFS